jgi:hypothetical protein
MDNNLIDFVARKESALSIEAYDVALETMLELTEELAHQVPYTDKQEIFRMLAEINKAWDTACLAAKEI